LEIKEIGEKLRVLGNSFGRQSSAEPSSENDGHEKQVLYQLPDFQPNAWWRLFCARKAKRLAVHSTREENP